MVGGGYMIAKEEIRSSIDSLEGPYTLLLWN